MGAKLGHKSQTWGPVFRWQVLSETYVHKDCNQRRLMMCSCGRGCVNVRVFPKYICTYQALILACEKSSLRQSWLIFTCFANTNIQCTTGVVIRSKAQGQPEVLVFHINLRSMVPKDSLQAPKENSHNCAMSSTFSHFHL